MPGIVPTPMPGVAGPPQYQVQRSLRSRSQGSPLILRTFQSGGNLRQWVLSCWVKRGICGSSGDQYIMSHAATPTALAIGGAANSRGDSLCSFYNDGSSQYVWHTGPAVFRDATAWYHIVWGVDTTQATPANRTVLWVNGVQYTSATGTAQGSGAQPPQNDTSVFNTAAQHVLCEISNGSYFDGYLAEMHFIDGLGYSPTNAALFAQIDLVTGQWLPKQYVGSYGVTGFKLDFSDNSSLTNLGLDRSGLGNNWAVNAAFDATNDSLVDSPTSYGTDNGAGGVMRGNYATLNPWDNSGINILDGNLTFPSFTGEQMAVASFQMSSGKWYWEFTINVLDNIVGIINQAAWRGYYPGHDANGWGLDCFNGNKINNAVSTAWSATFVAGDTIGVAFDADAGNLSFYKNGALQGGGAAFTGLTSGPYMPAVGVANYGSSGGFFNFGQRPYRNAAPAGYKSLCSPNLPTPGIVKPNTYFDVGLYTGSASPQSITGKALKPDLILIKNRGLNNDYRFVDSARGVGIAFWNPTLVVEQTEASGVTAFNADGFSLGAGLPSYSDGSGYQYLSWLWKIGAPFQIVTYTGNATNNRQIAHSLGVTPGIVFVRPRTLATSMSVCHQNNSPGYEFQLYSNAAEFAAGPGGTGSGGISAMDATSFTVVAGASDYNNVNSNGIPYVAYVFAPIPGFAAFGTYAGNSATAAQYPFIYTGFRPRLVMIKGKNASQGWIWIDSQRDPFNVNNHEMFMNTPDAEYSGGGYYDTEFHSCGFKLKSTNPWVNGGSTYTYVWAAWAEAPQKYARAR